MKWIFAILLLASTASAQLISRAQLVPLSNELSRIDTKDTFGSNYLWSLIQAKGDVTTAHLLFASNYLWSVSGMGGGSGVTLAELLAASNRLWIASATIGTNGTNHASAIGVALSNLSYTIGANGTNYSLAGATALTNLINSRSVALSNRIDDVSTSLSNLSYVIGANGTNFTRDTAAAVSNLVYIVGGNNTNYSATLYNILAARFTNYITTANGKGTNLSVWPDGSIPTGNIFYDNSGNVLAEFGAGFGAGATKVKFPQAWQEALYGYEKVAYIDLGGALESLELTDGLYINTAYPPTLGQSNNLLWASSFFRIQTNLTTATTQQVDYASGPSAYFLTKLTTNLVLQVTNLWTASVTNRVLDFLIGGGDSENYTVTFVCPNPAGVLFRWGVNSVTNGLTTVTVTNGMGLGVSITGWTSNTVEGYFSHIK